MSGFEFVQRGKVLIVKKQFQDAVKVCRLGLLAHPTLVEGRLVLGMALMALGRHDEVLAEMRVALELDKQSPLGHLLKGEALLRKGDLRQAGEVLTRAKELDPLNERVASLLDEVKQGRAASAPPAGAGAGAGGPRPGGAAAPTFGAEPTETRLYPAHRGSTVDPNDVASGTVTLAPPPVSRDDRPSAVAGAITASPPSRELLAVGDSSSTIVLESRDLVEDSSTDGVSGLEIASGDIEAVDDDDDDDVAPPPIGRPPAKPRATPARAPGPRGGAVLDSTATRVAAPAAEDLEATVEEEEPAPTQERLDRGGSLPPRAGSLPPRPSTMSPNVVTRAQAPGPEGTGESGDNYVVVDLATGPRVPPPEAAPRAGGLPLTAALDSIERMLEPDDYQEPLPAADYDEGRERSLRIARAAGGAAPAPAPSAPARSKRPPADAGEGGPTRPAKPSSRKPGPEAAEVVGGPAAGRAGPDDDTSRVKPGARPPPSFPDDEDSMESTSPAPSLLRRPGALPPPPAAPLPPPPRPAPPAEARSAPQPKRGPARAPGGPGGSADGGAARARSRPSDDPGGSADGGAARARSRPSEVRSSRERPAAEPTGTTRERSRMRTLASRFALKPWMLGLIALVVVGGAIGAGLMVREHRIKARIRELTAQAQELGRAQTYRAYAQAEANYRAILMRRDDPSARAALARVRAAMAAEYGDPIDEARALLEGLDAAKSRDAACAIVYVELALGDGEAALRAARDAVAGFGKDAEAHYLLGRALLYTDDVPAAADELATSIKLGATPLALVALAQAERERGRTKEALAALEQALELSPEHPGAVIERARLLAATGGLPPGGASPEAELTTILREGAQAQPDQPPLVSRAQLGWASLALAEVKLARGEVVPAKGALAAAAESRPGADRRFAEGLFQAYLAVGDTTAARAEAERAVQAWPARGEPHVWLARVALVEGKPEITLAELNKAQAAGATPEALGVRGQAKLLLGDLEGASRDLDDALAARPDDRALLLARAQVDLERGDAKAALARAEPLYKAKPEPELGVIYGAALRLSGDRERARVVLEEAVKSPRGRAAWIELARLEREEGAWDKAGEAYARAIEGSPRAIDARLEAATLAYDRGDARGGRESIDRLVQDAPADVEVLLQCARLHVATGDPEGAEKCLDALGQAGLTASQKGRLARERGRVLMMRREVAKAAGELKQAVAALPEDAEARLLYIDALLVLDDQAAVSAQLAEMQARLPGRPELELGRGRAHMAQGATGQAIAAFASADKALGARMAAPRLIADAKQWLGRAYYFNGDLGRAKAVLEEAVRLDPGHAEAHYYLGLLLFEQNQIAQSRLAFQRAVDANPYLAEAWFYLGDAARRLGERQKANEAFRTYLKLAPRGDFAGEAKRLIQG